MALALLALSFCLDLLGLNGVCFAAVCEGGSWFWGSTITTALFIVPGLGAHFVIPQKLKNKWLAIPSSLALWLCWIVLRAFMTDGEEFRPSVMAVVSVILFYKLATSDSPSMTVRFRSLGMKEKLVGSGQLTLILVSLLMAALALVAVATLSWVYRHNQFYSAFKGYVDEGAYKVCVERALESSIGTVARQNAELLCGGAAGTLNGELHRNCMHEHLQSTITDGIKETARSRCTDEWGIWQSERKYKRSYASFMSQDVAGALMLLAATTGYIYVLICTFVLYVSCANQGWQRLAIVISFIPGLTMGSLVYASTGSSVEGEEYLGILLSTATGYVIGILVILGGRRLASWVMDGFNSM
jgi:hypothetical protein